MKAIVAEINGKYAVVLTQTGLFKRVKASPDMEIGKEIDLNRPAENGRIAKSVMKVTSLAAAGLLALGAGIGAYSYTLPYSYVHVDINPSIELTVNMYDRIIGADALNEEGEALLSGNNLKNEKVDAGITRLLNSAVQQGYLNNTPAPTGNAPAQSTPEEPDTTEDKPETTHGGSEADEPEAPQITNAILVTVSSNNVKKSVNLEKELADVVSVELEKDHIQSEILVAKTTVEQRNDARRFGVTPGKLVLIEDAMESKSEAELEELKKAAINDLLVMATNKKMNREKQAAEQKEKTKEQKAEEAAKKKEGAERKAAAEAAKRREEAERKAAEKAAKKEEAERKKAEEAARKKEEAERKAAAEAAKRKEEAERKAAAEAAKRKEEAERKAAAEAAKRKEEAVKKKEEETKKNNNSWNQDRKNNQSENRDQGNKGKGPDVKNQENKRNSGKVTEQELKKERERLKDEILNQMNNKKKEQEEKRKGQNNQRRNNK